MQTLTYVFINRPKPILSLIFGLGVLALIGSWVVLYWQETLFTESHLAGYYCCVSAQDLPAPGTIARTVNDFFRTWPGKDLPALIFVGLNMGFFVVSLRRERGKAWLPFLFTGFNLLYLAAALVLVALSWSISDWIVGPQMNAYTGYHRTWYGIVLHLGLWMVTFVTLSRVPPQIISGRQARDHQHC